MAWSETSRPVSVSLSSHPSWRRFISELNKRRFIKTWHNFKHNKSNPFDFNISGGKRRSLSLLIFTLLSLILLISFLSQITNVSTAKSIQFHSNHLSNFHELEQIEQEPDFHLPPSHRKRNKFKKRRGAKKNKKFNPFVSEFLNESSEIHSLLFPDMDKVKSSRNSKYFYPGRIWLDTDGKPIQAHGGGILFDKNTGTYYWYGENKDGPTYHVQPKGTARVDVIGVSCYSSKDLLSWKNEGLVLKSGNPNPTHDLHKSNVLERPKVIFNDKTNKYVMWMHIDNANYTKASVGISLSESPIGPFEYLHSLRPHGCDSRDMTLFKDDNGKAYVVYSSRNNSDLHVGPLTDDYLGLTGIFTKKLVGQRREAPAVFKHNKTYYMMTSGCSGWAPNEAMVHVAQSMLGPWETLKNNPCLGGNMAMRNKTYFSQGTFVLPLNGLPGLFVFMADRWNPSDLKDSRYVWLPMKVEGINRVSVFWHKRWKIREGLGYN
ncbi:hypothetical protein LUZ60_008596 [Juncus effusus]|nr:hypothetical protein LUZ60_008596 [Juncus effusus]